MAVKYPLYYYLIWFSSISELQTLNRRRLNAKARNLGLIRFTGTKPELIDKIYEIETAKTTRKIHEFFNKVPKPKQENLNENKPKTTHITRNKRMRDDDDEDEDAALVSRKSLKLK